MLIGHIEDSLTVVQMSVWTKLKITFAQYGSHKRNCKDLLFTQWIWQPFGFPNHNPNPTANALHDARSVDGTVQVCQSCVTYTRPMTDKIFLPFDMCHLTISLTRCYKKLHF